VEKKVNVKERGSEGGKDSGWDALVVLCRELQGRSRCRSRGYGGHERRKRKRSPQAREDGRSDAFSSLIASAEGKKFRYTSRSDFHVSVDQLVYLLVEVQSEKDQSDRYRMLLQGACVARLGRQFYDKLHIVMALSRALYIENCGRVTRYLLFQHDGANTVCTFESKQSCVFSLVLLGFLCLGDPMLDATVPVIYYHIRSVQPGIDN
jgi:hypothetical protein